MHKFMMALAGTALATAAFAQTTTTAPVRGPAPVVTTPTTSMPASTTPAAPSATTTTGTGLVPRNTGAAAAAGDNNQAVATTSANAPQPARGKNSFTTGEARRRIERQGYASVVDLKKDTQGVWRGTGTKAGAQVAVWLDYKGNVGQQ